jgi:glyoxylase-like metal-dependent hydrolase (beta-lactamase superfamily II)
MFGNAPKALWSRFCPPDADNRIPLACRALLVERQGAAGTERLLLETGIGLCFPPELGQRFGVVEPQHVLLESLAALGLSDGDIDQVILSHLHFDHAGGLLAPYQAGQSPRLLFPRASFVVSAEALARAEQPHIRDRASFLPALPGLLRDSGRLLVLAGRAASDARLPGLRFHYSDGHTPGLLLTEVLGDSGSVIFLGDLVPGTAWVHLPMSMGYDRFPELLIDEKSRLLADLADRRSWLFYTHDPVVAMSRVERAAAGRMVPSEEQSQVVRQLL